VGTAKATPFSLPFNAGGTRATALAAPVEVGTMFIAAARVAHIPVTGIQQALIPNVAVGGGHRAFDAELFV